MDYKIMFSCSMRGGRQMLSEYKKIAQVLSLAGFDFVTMHQIDDQAFEKEESLTSQEIYLRDVNFIQKSDFIIAEITVPSLGVGAEIVIARSVGKPVLCIYREDAKSVSEFILGMEGVVSKSYCSIEDVAFIVKTFVKDLA